MTIEEMFCYFDDKYGDEFNWGMLPFTDKHFVEELKREIGDDNQIFDNDIWAVARSYSSDDTLYLLGNEKGTYRIYHLTYSKNNTAGFPKFVELTNIEEVKCFLEKQFVEEYM